MKKKNSSPNPLSPIKYSCSRNELHKNMVLVRNRIKCLHAASDLSWNSWLLEKYGSVPTGEAVMCPACSPDTGLMVVCKHFQPLWHRGCRTMSDINYPVNK